MQITSFYSNEELNNIGFSSIGDNVLISRKCSIYSPERITIGNNVRIDDFCILSGLIKIGDYVHIAAYCGLFAGDAGIEIGSYATTSSRCAVYAISDDYSGESLTNPTIPDEYKKCKSEKVTIGNHSIIGAGCTILPGIKIEEGVAVGSMSLINRSLSAWKICYGIPCKEMKDRSRNLLTSPFLS